MARGPLSDMPDPEDVDASPPEAEPAEDDEESMAGSDLADAVKSGDGKEIFAAMEHIFDLLKSKGPSSPVEGPPGKTPTLDLILGKKK